MDGFSRSISKLLTEAGIEEENIFQRISVELPGYFRPTKEWDIVVVVDGNLIAAIELKSQIGPSFGNNFNNRTEEALGTAMIKERFQRSHLCMLATPCSLGKVSRSKSLSFDHRIGN